MEQAPPLPSRWGLPRQQPFSKAASFIIGSRFIFLRWVFHSRYFHYNVRNGPKRKIRDEATRGVNSNDAHKTIYQKRRRNAIPAVCVTAPPTGSERHPTASISLSPPDSRTHI